MVECSSFSAPENGVKRGISDFFPGRRYLRPWPSPSELNLPQPGQAWDEADFPEGESHDELARTFYHGRCLCVGHVLKHICDSRPEKPGAVGITKSVACFAGQEASSRSWRAMTQCLFRT